jgi:hypothetical protein
LSVSICFVFEGQFNQPSADVVGEVVIQRNISVLYNGKLDRGHCGILVPVEKNEGLGIFDEVCFRKQDFLKTFSSRQD